VMFILGQPRGCEIRELVITHELEDSWPWVAADPAPPAHETSPAPHRAGPGSSRLVAQPMDMSVITNEAAATAQMSTMPAMGILRIGRRAAMDTRVTTVVIAATDGIP
jgi:hypothetical protein